MNDQLQSKLAEILSGIQSAVKTGSDFAVVQLPDIVQSYVEYGRAIATLQFAAAFLVFVVSTFCAVKFGYANTKGVNKSGSWGEQRVFASIGGTLVGFFSLVVACTLAEPMLMVWFAPKVWLLKELASLIK